MLAKATELPADELVLDLEDAVAPSQKPEARARVAALLGRPAFADRTVAVRVNAIGTPWCREDVAAVVATRHPPLTLVVPKVENAGDLALVDRMLDDAEATSGAASNVGVQALIETALGLANVQAIAAASARLRSLILGYADLASSLRRKPDSGRSWMFAQELMLLAARANGLQAIDGPFMEIGDNDRLRAECEAVRDLGFDGKWAIHPSQIEILNDAFTPGREEVEGARALIAHLNESREAGAGASAFRGRMVDEAMRAGALDTLARAGVAP
jgi:citrate lyase subunit beta/citryl-CoA lyase